MLLLLPLLALRMGMERLLLALLLRAGLPLKDYDRAASA
jgi:hypothetical protein